MVLQKLVVVAVVQNRSQKYSFRRVQNSFEIIISFGQSWRIWRCRPLVLLSCSILSAGWERELAFTSPEILFVRLTILLKCWHARTLDIIKITDIFWTHLIFSTNYEFPREFLWTGQKFLFWLQLINDAWKSCQVTASRRLNRLSDFRHFIRFFQIISDFDHFVENKKR